MPASKRLSRAVNRYPGSTFTPEDVANRQEERTARKKDNTSPREQADIGAALKDLTNRLLIVRRCLNTNGKEVNSFFCLGCDNRTMNNHEDRVLKHANRCCKLEREFPAVWKEARERLVGKSTRAIMSGENNPPPVRQPGKRKLEEEVTEIDEQVMSAELRQSYIDESFGSSKISARRQSWIDFTLLRFIICCFLAFSLLDNIFFLSFVRALYVSLPLPTCPLYSQHLISLPGYSVPDRSSFFTGRLASHAEDALEVIFKHLALFQHLTLSFDGYSTKGHDEIYTVHLTNFLRRSFLVDGLILTGLSCTADTIFTHLLPIIAKITATRISMVVSDSAKNVHNTRKKIVEKWPWIFTCPDPCHLLNLLAKDLIVGSKTHPKIKTFADVMGIVSTFTTYFAHSNYGLYWLKEEMEKESDKRCIIAAGGTRFSTFSVNAESVLRCWPAMKRCYDRGVLLFTAKGSAAIKQYLGNDDLSHEFLGELRIVIRILVPIRRGLLTLEGQQITPSDVFFVFTGVAIGFKRVFSDPKSKVFSHRNESFAAFDRRWAFLNKESTPMLFLIGYLLDPGMSQSYSYSFEIF
jgi:hypothetical protein